MGYESRIYIVQRYALYEKPTAIILAEIDMSKMGYGNGFREMFKKRIDYKLYRKSIPSDCDIDINHEFDSDMYGEHLQYTSIDRVINWLNVAVANGNDYDMLLPLFGLLKGFKMSRMKGLQVVHFGY